MWKWSHGHESDPHWLSSWHKVGGPWHHAWRESCYNVVEFICTGHGLHRINPSTYTVSSWWTQPIAQSVCQPIRTLESGLMQCLLLERSNHGAEIGGGRDFVTSSCGALSDNFLRARECLCVFCVPLTSHRGEAEMKSTKNLLQHHPIGRWCADKVTGKTACCFVDAVTGWWCFFLELLSCCCCS